MSKKGIDTFGYNILSIFNHRQKFWLLYVACSLPKTNINSCVGDCCFLNCMGGGVGENLILWVVASEANVIVWVPVLKKKCLPAPPYVFCWNSPNLLFLHFQQINTDKLTTFINTINGKDGNRYQFCLSHML